MATKARLGNTYRAARRNAARSNPFRPFEPRRPPAVHQPDRLTLRSIMRAWVRANPRYLRP